MNQVFSKIWILMILIVFIVGGIYWWQKLGTQEQPNTKPFITLLSPNGGEVWEIGSKHTIKWTTQNIPSTDKISIHIRRVPPPPLPTEGQEFDPIIFIDLENDGSEDWTISDMYPVGNYLIEVNSYPSLPITNVVSDESDAPFKIASSSDETANWEVYRNEEYGFEIKYPNYWKISGEGGLPPFPAEGVLYLFSVYFQKKISGGDRVEIEIYEQDFLKGVGVIEGSYWEIGEDVMVGNYPAKKVHYRSRSNVYVEDLFYALQNNYDYVIRPVVPGCGGVGVKIEPIVNDRIPEFYDILSTFKFIEK